MEYGQRKERKDRNLVAIFSLLEYRKYPQQNGACQMKRNLPFKTTAKQKPKNHFSSLDYFTSHSLISAKVHHT